MPARSTIEPRIPGIAHLVPNVLKAIPARREAALHNGQAPGAIARRHLALRRSAPVRDRGGKCERGSKALNIAAGALIVAAALGVRPAGSQAMSTDEAEIRAIENSFTAAINAKDVDAMMKVYLPGESLVVFDVIPPRQYLGVEAYRKDWQKFFALLKGPPKFSITDLHVEVDGNVGYSYSIQHLSGIDMQGRAIDLVVRVTDGYRKVGGKWLKAHEHVSVPVDLATGKADLQSKP